MIKNLHRKDLFFLEKVKSTKVISYAMLLGKKNERYNDNRFKPEFFYKPIMLL
jgi:hypothetical protein